MPDGSTAHGSAGAHYHDVASQANARRRVLVQVSCSSTFTTLGPSSDAGLCRGTDNVRDSAGSTLRLMKLTVLVLRSWLREHTSDCEAYRRNSQLAAGTDGLYPSQEQGGEREGLAAARVRRLLCVDEYMTLTHSA